MRVLKDNPAFETSREKLKSYFSGGDLFYSADTHLAFVCGAAGDFVADGVPSMRAAFIRYVAGHAGERIVCIKAEAAVADLLRQDEERNSNLSDFEKLIAETVDSVVIFPESPGSFAELGYFSAFKDICKKTFVCVREEYQDNSFISLGPIHYISSVSKYRPLPLALGGDFEQRFQGLCERVAGNRDRRPYRKRFSFGDWKELDARQQLAVIDEIIRVASALTEIDLLHAIHSIFGNYDVSRVRMLLSLLVAAERVARNDAGDIFSIATAAKDFIEGQRDDRVSLKARWLSAFEQHAPEVLGELRAVRNE